MIAKIFKRVSIQAFVASFFLCFFFVLFVAFCFNNGVVTNKAFFKAFFISCLFIIITLLVSFSENRNINQKFGAIHLLSFPIAILLYNYEGGFGLLKAFIGFILLVALNVFTRDFKDKQPTRQIFLLGILITGISFFNYNFALFYSVPLLFFLDPQYRLRKNGILFLVSIALTLQFLMVICYLFTDHFFYISTPVIENSKMAFRNQLYFEIPWIITIIISLIISLRFRPKEYKSATVKTNTYRAFQFMFLWLVISILFRSLDLYQGNEKWILSFIPTAFFLGIRIEYVKKEWLKNGLILVLISGAILTKLYLHEFISF